MCVCVRARVKETHVNGKVKVKLSLCSLLTDHHARKAYWGNEGVASLRY
jgi:hypothetical protein